MPDKTDFEKAWEELMDSMVRKRLQRLEEEASVFLACGFDPNELIIVQVVGTDEEYIAVRN